ncbi:hypothetical protein OHS33_03750 [Streptomyces sp. NBC_00536]|nr:hypothetical protein [Streptomyces sp. NBC_00536]WUC77529.1 hypothetical protein OHS33_03750 [Streptomyces sp. NBC_00536]
MQTAYDTNTFGAVRVTHASLPFLEAGDATVVVNVSRGPGAPPA